MNFETLVRWMAADFSNQEQAFENPPFFAHIRFCMRPLPAGFLPGASLFIEQAYNYQLNHPYRMRVLEFHNFDDHIDFEYYKILEPEAYYGAVRDRNKLNQLSADQLVPMPGCGMRVRWESDRFVAHMQPGKQCIVVRNGQESYLDSRFEINAECMLSYDLGRDPATGEQLWGSKAGPFHFLRKDSFADEVAF